ncbi:MAG TPA: T9SS type A sorting domain-containing protein [Salinivirgaceae bacterium]|nr:T9SS type A sorting domain-containing protein [Salinivirgaceae bacterium]HQA75871.1 T9SS type A sorting domain-containing protein [Salinivirgaceae bacterium]
MKKAVLTIFLLNLLFGSVKGQEFYIRLFVTDSSNRRDTIELGIKNNATLGVDASFGEKDIYGEPWDSLDMRIIQRDSITHHCLTQSLMHGPQPSQDIYFDRNRDFKIDYRPFGYSWTIDMNFEILIHSLNPPIYITSDFSGMSTSGVYNGWSALYLLNSDCSAIETESISYYVDYDTIFISNDTLTTLVVEFQGHVSVEETNSQNIKIYPNPSQTEIYIIADNPTVLKLYDVFGREIKESYENKLDISKLETGLYIIRVFDLNGYLLKTEKLIKE